MADDTLDILIRTTADKTGTQQSITGLNEVTDATNKGSDATKKHSAHVKGLHKLFHGLNEIVPGLGVLMQAAFSPVGATISVALMALKLFHEKMKEFDEECKKAEEEAVRPLTSRLEQQRQTVVATADGLERLKERLADAALRERTFKESIEVTTAALKADHEAQGALATAANSRKLARLEEEHAAGIISDEQFAKRRLEIEQDFQDKKRQLAEQEEMAEILIRKRQLELAEIRQPVLTAAATEAEQQKEEALENLGSYDKASIDERHKASGKNLEEFVAKHPQWVEWFSRVGTDKNPAWVSSTLSTRENLSAFEASGGFKGMLGGAGLSDMYSEWVKLKSAADLAEKDWKKAPGEEARLKVAVDRADWEAGKASQRAEENQGFIRDTGRNIEDRQSLFSTRKRANQELSAMERDPFSDAAGRDVSAAVRTAGEMTAHRDTTRDQQQQLMEVASALAGHRTSLREAVSTLSAAGKDIGMFGQDVLILTGAMKGLATAMPHFHSELQLLRREVEIIKSQTRDSYNH